MKISIVVPNYNGEETLEECIKSILANEYKDLEIILFDGGSTDKSVDIIKKYESQIYCWQSKSDSGQYAAIQEGITCATGEISGWLNSDDMYFPWTLRVVSEIFSLFPHVRWISGLRTVRHQGATRSVSGFQSYPRQLVRCGLFDGRHLSYIQQESLFWRSDLWNEVGGLDLSYKYAADFDLWRRFGAVAELYAVETPLGGFHDRDGANRSSIFAAEYRSEVLRSVQSLSRDLAKERVAWARRMKTFQKWRWLQGVRGGLRRMMAIDELCGPILMWSRPDARYVEGRSQLF